MKRVLVTFVAIVALIVLASSPLAAADIDADITVSPNVINIASASMVVTVHTAVPFGTVVTSSVYLNGVLIQSWKADDRGYFVAKFSSDEIKALPEVAGTGEKGVSVELTLKGTTVDDEEFSGTDEVKVINVTGKKKK